MAGFELNLREVTDLDLSSPFDAAVDWPVEAG
jgi:hypothetical protein